KGLLLPRARSENGYRWYGEAEISTLGSIVAYRAFGLPVAKIKDLINRKDEAAQARILSEQFKALEQEVLVLRQQQKAIVQLLQQSPLQEHNMVTKDRWVEIMQAAGFSDEDMINWHKKFELMEPDEHHKFLESLGIDAEEITKIRQL
ncbi:MAG: MerR family transcriptional regulator, partial [Methylococcales bacterium]|nr:MerR family transcriptional regulator [Methylococcales bacterium]